MKHGNIDEQINVKTTITCVTLCRIMFGGAAIAALFMSSGIMPPIKKGRMLENFSQGQIVVSILSNCRRTAFT